KGRSFVIMSATQTANVHWARSLKMPVSVILLLQFLVVMAAIAIPLGYISLHSAETITSQLTEELLFVLLFSEKNVLTATQTNIDKTVNYINFLFTRVTDQGNLIMRDPNLDAILKYHSQDYSIDQANLSMTLVHQMEINPLLESIAVIIEDREAYSTNQVGLLGMVLIPCSIPGTVSLAGNCYGRIFMSPAGGPNIYMAFIDPVTGEDI
ncbi:hypothetical protein HDU84_000383, partial [Entophlyctis sp. JEL0112]